MAIRSDETLEIENDELVLRFTEGPGGAENLGTFISMIDQLGDQYGIYRVRYIKDEFGIRRSAKTFIVDTDV